MEGKVIIYAIVLLFYLVTQIRKAQKKRSEQMQRTQGNTTARPIQPPTPQKDIDTYRDIKDLSGNATQRTEGRRKPKQKKPEPAQQFNPPSRREYQAVTFAPQELDENYSDSSMQDMIKYEQPRDLQTTVAPATVNYDADMVNPILNNFDLRNALIAQIILERPEF